MPDKDESVTHTPESGEQLSGSGNSANVGVRKCPADTRAETRSGAGDDEEKETPEIGITAERRGN